MLQQNPPKCSFDVYDYSVAIQFYSDVLNKISPTSSFPIQRLVGRRGQAPPEVQRVAVNEMELKSFLTRYPSIFKVTDNNCVRLAENIVKNRSVNTTKHKTVNYDIAVEFYVNVMKRKLSASNSSHLSLNSLFSYRSQAPPEVQKCAKNINEFLTFITSKPETFNVSEGRFVSLCKSATVIEKNEQNPVVKPKYDDSASAVEYYSKILSTTGSDYPFQRLIGHRGQAPLKVQNVAHTAAELKLFLSKFPNTFSISDNGVSLKKVVLDRDSYTAKCNVLSETGKSQSKSANCNPDIAIQFYADILRKRGCYGKECPIKTLTGYRSQAPIEVQNCAKNPNELYILFSNYPKVFTVTSNKGVILIEPPLNNLVNKVQNLSLESVPNKCDSTKAIQYFSDIIRSLVSYSPFPIANLMGYLKQAPADVLNVVRNETDLINFFLRYPDSFTIVQNKFVKLVNPHNAQVSKSKPVQVIKNLNVNTNSRTLSYFPYLEYPRNEGFPGSWEDHVLENTILVTEEDECLEACEVIKKEKIIALDCEGYNLGRGILSLIQIALINGKVYIFDIYELPKMISCGLKEIIESENILKVINHCRNDYINLKGQYNVDMKYIFDVAVAYHVIECKMMTLSNFKAAGFNQICAKYGVPTNTCKDDFKFVYFNQPKYWLIRPLNTKMVSYAAFDVASLVPYLYCEFLKRMDSESEYAIWKLSQKMCIT